MRSVALERAKEVLDKIDHVRKGELMSKYRSWYEIGRDSGLDEEELERRLEQEIEDDFRLEGIILVDESTEEVEEEWKEGGGGEQLCLKISLIAEDLSIEYGDDEDNVIIFDGDYRVEDYRLANTPKLIKIVSLVKERKMSGAKNRILITVRLGKNARILKVDGRTISGDLQAESLTCEGEILIKSISGDVEFEDLAGESLKVETVSGDISANSLTARSSLALQSISGDIKAEQVAATKGRVQTTSGDIEIGRIKGEIDCRTISGEGEVDGRRINNLAGSLKSKVGGVMEELKDLFKDGGEE